MNGSPPYAACRAASLQNHSSESAPRTSPLCTAASSPAEWTNPPTGKPESASCRTIQESPPPSMRVLLENRIALRQRQHLCGFALQFHSVGDNGIRFGIHSDLRQRIIQLHIALGQVPALLHRYDAFGETVTGRHIP